MKRLANAQEIWSADPAFQSQALKYMAFSYCVTSSRKLCRQQFEKALKPDPDFDLTSGQKGHPCWGAVFNQAKKAAAIKAANAKKPAADRLALGF
ncbi:TssQ family T6SS-associated lipoprotein [Collimonas sp.]|uniref:TssQ family T6SS-associated lipoprotein n=1 Tax=Collimonas sp. TaxID=1963772 RepID=UPI0037BECFE9